MKTGTKAIQILAADDHALLRQGIAALVELEPDMELVGEASTGREAIEQFRRHQPDVTLMDVRMPDISGIEAIIAIRSEFSDARIVVLTTYSGDVQVVRAESGARGYLLKESVHSDLLETIRAVHAARKRIPPEAAAARYPAAVLAHASQSEAGVRLMAGEQGVALRSQSAARIPPLPQRFHGPSCGDGIGAAVTLARFLRVRARESRGNTNPNRGEHQV